MVNFYLALPITIQWIIITTNNTCWILRKTAKQSLLARFLASSLSESLTLAPVPVNIEVHININQENCFRLKLLTSSTLLGTTLLIVITFDLEYKKLNFQRLYVCSA